MITLQNHSEEEISGEINEFFSKNTLNVVLKNCKPSLLREAKRILANYMFIPQDFKIVGSL